MASQHVGVQCSLWSAVIGTFVAMLAQVGNRTLDMSPAACRLVTKCSSAGCTGACILELVEAPSQRSAVGRATCCSETHDDWHSCRTDTKRSSQVAAICTNFKLQTVMGNTQACAASMVAWFFGSTCIPQISVRVKQLSDRITMWSVSDVDTKNIFWRLWNQATGFMSATIYSVLEAPVTLGFWKA